MIGLGVVEGRGLFDFGGDGAQPGLGQFCLERFLAGLGFVQLFRFDRVDHRTVLGTDVVALAHSLGWVMQLPEHRQQFFVADLVLVIHHQDHFGVAGQARADFLVGRVGGEAAGITHRRADHAFTLPELAFRAPEAAQAEDRELHVADEGTQHVLVLIDEVFLRYGDRGFAAGQGLFFSWEHVFVHQNFRAQDHDQSSQSEYVSSQTASVPNNPRGSERPQG